MGQILFGNATACIFDNGLITGYTLFIRRQFFKVKGNGSAIRRIFNGITDQVGIDFSDFCGIA